MPEPITTTEPQNPPIEPGTGELARLRTTNVELLATKKTLKARVIELESEIAVYAGKLTASENRVRIMTIDGPVKQLAESVSKAPAAFTQAFLRTYSVQPGTDGKLMVMHAADGKPVMVKDKPVPFEADAVKELLLASDSPADVELYRSILVASRASGMIIPPLARPSQTADDRQKEPVAAQFGLR